MRLKISQYAKMSNVTIYNIVKDNIDNEDDDDINKECFYLYIELNRIDSDSNLMPKQCFNIAINEQLSSFIKRNIDIYPYKLNVISFKRITKREFNKLKKYNNVNNDYIKLN